MILHDLTLLQDSCVGTLVTTICTLKLYRKYSSCYRILLYMNIAKKVAIHVSIYIHALNKTCPSNEGIQEQNLMRLMKG